MFKVFIDADILVCSLDQADPHKLKKCRELIKSLASDRTRHAAVFVCDREGVSPWHRTVF
jgi:hypothetical protein